MSDIPNRDNPDREELIRRIIKALEDAPYKILFMIAVMLKKV